ncbi:MAG: glycerophosphodiester phosphodiesterase [Deltaproteobacteria bacterium]|nr:glycerophosphodiester phosphodiesterase [Deltaproteobacteria bacterium]
MPDFPSPDRVMNIAHRGAPSLAPENTLAAAQKAAEVGADMWELDLQATRDGEIVAVHDPTLERTSNAAVVFPGRRPWRVGDFTLQELRRLDFGSWFEEADPHGQVAAGLISASDLRRYRGEMIPTLREALEFSRQNGMGVNAEIKDLSAHGNTIELLQRLIRGIKELNMLDRVIVSSFHHDLLKHIKQLDNNVVTGLLVSSFRHNPEELLQSVHADAYHPPLGAISQASIRRLQSLGYMVSVWVANDTKTMTRLIRDRVNGIFTDFPQTLASLLASPA